MFVSYSFIIFLVFVFFLYYIIPKRWQWVLLLIVSLLFYAAADVRYLAFIVATSLSVYAFSLRLEYYSGKRRQYDAGIISGEIPMPSREEKRAFRRKLGKKQKRIAACCLLLNLGILAAVKYTNFAIHNINGILEKTGNQPFSAIDMIVPLGISFYTFQAIGYLLDVYWGKCPVQKNYFRLLLFISFFPQLVQGPISRYGSLSGTLFQKHSFDMHQIALGVQRILWGYFKKLVVADRAGIVVAALAESPRHYTGAYVAVAMLFYAIQLYADFTGGIDITIGIAQAMGIRIEENFIRPYFSKNIAEYWRRWHISMGTWFKDYVFYPLSISHPVKKLSTLCKNIFGRSFARRSAIYLSTIITWLATGIWHGAEWRFVIWGLLNGVIILLSEECEPLYKRFHNRFPLLSDMAIYRFFQVLRTFALMSCLRLFDVYGSVRGTVRQFIHMFTQFNTRLVTKQELLNLGLDVADFIILFLSVGILLLVSMSERKGCVRERIAKKPYALRYVLFVGLFLCILLFGTYGQGYDVQQFIYNKF